MAGQGFFKGILNSTPMKKLTQNIKANVKVNGTEFVKKAARAGKKTMKNNLDEAAQAIIKKSDGLIKSADEIADYKNSLKAIDNPANKEILGLIDDYENMSKNFKKSAKHFRKVEDGVFFEDISKEANKKMKEELDTIVKNAKNNKQDIDIDQVRNSLKEKYKVENKWTDVNKAREAELKKLDDLRVKELEGVDKNLAEDALKAENKRINDLYDKKLRNKNKSYARQDKELYKEFGYYDGSRMDEFNKAMSGGQAKMELLNQYLGTGATGTERAWRAGTIGAAVVGTGVAGRLISGGSIGYNANGERDIAGIPFI